MLRGLTLLAILFSATAFGAIDKSVELKPVHEALVTRVSPLAPIEVISQQPPAPRYEQPPAQPNPNMQWIEGYWAWDRDARDFVWVCGIWRLAPSSHSWVSGYWQNSNNGYWWVGGYWNKDGSLALVSKKAPPNAPEEKMGRPPSDQYFWAPGYWNYQSGSQQFSWLGGSWQPYDDHVVFVPAFWQYRPEGYMFHPAFWDWTLADRGQAYDCDGGAALVPLPAETIISRIYVWYPDYSVFFWFHWHCCNDFWLDCWCSPPWWGWWGWWGFSWADSWWLWWWWGHPGFAGPPWVFPVLFNQIAAPDQDALDLLGRAPKPPFITPNGIPPLDDWLDAIEDLTGDRTPLIPEDQLDEAADQAGQNLPDPDTSRPSGKPDTPNVDRPDFDDTAQPQGTAPVPQVPPQRPDQSGGNLAPVPERPQYSPPSYTPVPPRVTQPSYPRPDYRPPSYQPRPQRPPTIQPPSWQDNYPPIRRPHRPSRPIKPPQWTPPSRAPDYPQTGPSRVPQTDRPSQSTPRYPQGEFKPSRGSSRMQSLQRQDFRNMQRIQPQRQGNTLRQTQPPPQSERQFK